MNSVLHVGVGNSSTVPSADVAFWVEAARLQVEQVARCWGIDPPGVAFYEEPSALPEDTVAVVEIVNDDGDDSASGEHMQFGKRVFAMVDAHQSPLPPRTLAHEVAELVINPHLDRWVAGPDGRRWAREICDPVQRSGYVIEVELFGEKRSVTVSDFVLPAWFGLPNPPGIDPAKTAFATAGIKPFEVAPGGYQVVMNADGTTESLGEVATGLRARALMAMAKR